MAYTEEELKKELETKEYEYGFYTDIESDTFPIGLSEEIVVAISKKKEEPEWMTQWRLDAYRSWLEMEEPEWANVHYTKPDFQAISYYSAPNKKPKYDSIDEVDPELLDTFKRLGISLDEQKMLAGVAVDIVMDSVSVATTFKKTLGEKGIIFCSISEAIKEHPEKRIFLLSQMIHNPDVNEDLESHGLKFLQDTYGKQLIPFDELTSDDIVIIPAFGTTVEIENLLKEKGITYAPDFLINAGGIINVYAELENYGKSEIIRKTENLYNTTLEILNNADANGITTHQAAFDVAKSRIDARKLKNNAEQLN